MAKNESTTPVQKVESKFSKIQILKAGRYQHRRDLLESVLDDKKVYAHTEIEQIIKDFTEAIAKLPAEWSSSQVGRPAKDAAKALLAKAYLHMATAPLNDASCYAKAAAMAKEVMDGGRYRLVHDIAEVFSMDTKYGPEMMWSFNANRTVRSTAPLSSRLPGVVPSTRTRRSASPGSTPGRSAA